jgi:hypothetical protein
VVHGPGHDRTVGRELLEQNQPVPDVEDGEQQVGPLVGAQRLERGVAGEGASLRAERVEDEVKTSVARASAVAPGRGRGPRRRGAGARSTKRK